MRRFGDFMDLRRHEADAGFRVGGGIGVDPTGRLTLGLAGPLYVDQDGNLNIRVDGETLRITTGSPKMLAGPAPRTLVSANQVVDSAGTTTETNLRRITDAIATINTQIAAGLPKARGLATLVAGTVTVSTASVATGDLVFLTRQTGGGTFGELSAENIVDATSFDINSDNPLDTSDVAWMVVSP